MHCINKLNHAKKKYDIFFKKSDAISIETVI